MRDFFAEGLIRIGIDYNDAQLDKLLAFYEELSIWNKKTGFLKAEGNTLVVKHFFDSLAGAPLLSQMNFNTIADIGTGAGFPGIPLSIFFPDKLFTLVERSGKKTAFLNNCKMLFSLDNIQIEESELENIKSSFDAVTFRAFRNFVEYYKELFRIVNPKGFLFSYKGKKTEIETEMRAAGIQIFKIEKVAVPFLEEERHIVICGTDAAPSAAARTLHFLR
ncbi:MAG: 16S rRNA (guanine(527)-N(7))-methyltransferase RsmG [Spirochaetes bacterium]|nr:16S rRNA (guanine(527)-N(7))-methyltransferase RsmG [Spirochaetota bacterium]